MAAVVVIYPKFVHRELMTYNVTGDAKTAKALGTAGNALIMDRGGGPTATIMLILPVSTSAAVVRNQKQEMPVTAGRNPAPKVTEIRETSTAMEV